MVPTRRTLLASAGALLASVAGCVSTTGLQAPTDTPPDVNTPRPGDCVADRPHPSTGDGLPAPRDYPEGPPELTAEPVREFVQRFEEAYRYNELLVEVAAQDDCLDNLGASVNEVTVEAAGAGFTAHAETFAHYTGAPCGTATGTDTPTPAPHADIPGAADYYLTDRFLLRDGTAVACW